jgi:hypothetical protein
VHVEGQFAHLFILGSKNWLALQVIVGFKTHDPLEFNVYPEAHAVQVEV